MVFNIGGEGFQGAPAGQRAALRRLVVSHHVPLVHYALLWLLTARLPSVAVVDAAKPPAAQQPEDAALAVVGLRPSALDTMAAVAALRARARGVEVVLLGGAQPVVSDGLTEDEVGHRLQARAILRDWDDLDALVSRLNAYLGAPGSAAPRMAPADSTRLGDGAAGLTPQQRKVLSLVVDGLRNREIADDLGIAENTVKIHVSAILAKLNLPSRAALIARVRGA